MNKRNKTMQLHWFGRLAMECRYKIGAGARFLKNERSLCRNNFIMQGIPKLSMK